MARGTIVVTCGLPGSGKSLFVSKLVEQFNAVVISEDALVTAVHGGKYTNYNPLFKDLYHGLEDLILDLMLKKGHHLIVVDRCCPKAATRHRFASAARAQGYRTVLAFFDLERPSDGDKVRNRMRADARGYPAEKWAQVIRDMKKGFELPSRQEPFDVIAPPDIALTFIKIGVTEDLDAKGSAATGLSQAADQSSERQPSQSGQGPAGPGTEAVTTPTPSQSQTVTAPQPDAVPPVGMDQPQASPQPTPQESPARPARVVRGPRRVGKSESTAQGG